MHTCCRPILSASCKIIAASIFSSMNFLDYTSLQSSLESTHFIPSVLFIFNGMNPCKKLQQYSPSLTHNASRTPPLHLLHPSPINGAPIAPYNFPCITAVLLSLKIPLGHPTLLQVKKRTQKYSHGCLLPLPSQCNNLVLPLHIETHHWNPVHHATVRSFSFSVLHHEAHIHHPLSVVTPHG